MLSLQQDKQVRKSLDQIVEGYNKKIAGLLSLTAELSEFRAGDAQNLNGVSNVPLGSSSNDNAVLSALQLLEPGDQLFGKNKGSTKMAAGWSAGGEPGSATPGEQGSPTPSLTKRAMTQHEIDKQIELVTGMGKTSSHGIRTVVRNVEAACKPDEGTQRFVLHRCCPCLQRLRPKSYTVEPAETVDNIEQIMFKEFRSGRFDYFVVALIVTNCLSMIVQSEWVGYTSEVTLGAADSGKWPHAQRYFDMTEHVFNLLFISEMCIRFYLLRWSIFKDRANIFDLILVGGTSLQLYILQPIGSASPKFIFLRMLRFVKVLRAFRMARVFHLFSALRILANTIMSSLVALVTSMALLFIFIIMGGLFLSDLLVDFIIDETQDMVQRQWVFKHYGSSLRAMYTLFEVTLAGCWPTYVSPLIDHVSVWYVIFVVIYISFVVFAIIRIITALFLKETLMAASNDAQMMVQEKLKSKQGYVKKLEAVFKIVDFDDTGKVHEEQFAKIISNSNVKTWLQVLDLEVHDAHALFKLMDDGDGEITYEEFLQGILRLKGQAREMDSVCIMRANELTLKGVKQLRMQVAQILSRLYLEQTNKKYGASTNTTFGL